jgi:MTH538 TIR-like domain (DUF1863)
MARRAFFSFHYQRDVHRAWVVRNSWVTQERQDAGFFDSSVFESKQRTSDDALKRFLDDGLVNCSVTCVLIGNQTAWRRWVRYELLRSFAEGKGMLGVSIQTISKFNEGPDIPGPNPFSLLGFVVQNQTLYFKEWNAQQGQWIWSPDLPNMPLARVQYNLGYLTNATFDQLFPIYDWSAQNGFSNLGTWIDTAAKAAGR